MAAQLRATTPRGEEMIVPLLACKQCATATTLFNQTTFRHPQRDTKQAAATNVSRNRAKAVRVASNVGRIRRSG
jgi:hypothetical protein